MNNCRKLSLLYLFQYAGTYGSQDRLPSANSCTICPPGEYCSVPGASLPDGSCLPGFFCSNRSEEANPVGKVCKKYFYWNHYRYKNVFASINNIFSND